MSLEALIHAYQEGNVTRTELFAALTQLLSANPEMLSATKQELAFEADTSAAFESWLEDLKSFPRVTLGAHPVVVSAALVSLLGPPREVAVRTDARTGLPILTTAEVTFHVPASRRPTKRFAAQLRTTTDAEGAFGRWRVVVEPMAEVEAEDGTAKVGVVISLASPDAPLDLLRPGDVELFQGTERIGVATIHESMFDAVGGEPRADSEILAA
jgi:hypothetical protein